jgi:nitroreductase
MADNIRMIKGSEIRKPDHEIEPILLDRWSPRAMSGEEISHEELMRLFEAARWAPSSFNAQQWRALYARRGTEHWQTFFDLLVDANKAWAKNAAVLVVFISRKNFDYNDEPSVTHSYDCGAAWQQNVRNPTMPSSNALDPQSPQARAIYELAIHSTIILALIFVIVAGAIIYTILRFCARPAERSDALIHPARCELTVGEVTFVEMLAGENLRSK